jgi:hypothetical protein
MRTYIVRLHIQHPIHHVNRKYNSHKHIYVLHSERSLLDFLNDFSTPLPKRARLLSKLGGRIGMSTED